MDWIEKNALRLVAVLVAIAIVCLIFGLRACQQERVAGTEAKLANGQAGAAIASGSDAVQTVGNSQAAETGIHQTVTEGQNEIAQAPGGDSNDAADRAACRMRSYRHSARCVALLGPAP